MVSALHDNLSHSLSSICGKNVTWCSNKMRAVLVADVKRFCNVSENVSDSPERDALFSQWLQ